MKTILIIILSFSLTASFAQMHFGFPVKELDSTAAADSNRFYHHPIYLDVDVIQKTYTVNILNTVTKFREDITNEPFYIAKYTHTDATLEIPKSIIDLQTAVNADGHTLNIPNLNAILASFGLKYDASSTLQVVTPK